MPSYSCGCSARGIMVLYTPLGRQLAEHERVNPAHPWCVGRSPESIRASPSRSSSGWKRRPGDGIETRRRLSGVVAGH